MSSATSQKLLSWKRETLRFPRSSTRTRSGQCKFCLNHCSAGVIYCQCGRLMTKDAAENKRYISGILDTFSIPRFYIRKNRPRGHRYGKSQGCKEYHTAHQLAKKCRKKKYDSIHDRYIRDKRPSERQWLRWVRSEQMIIEMDKLANEDHTYTASREEIEFYRGNWWIHTNVARVDSIPTRYEPEFKSALSTMQRLKRAEDKKKQEASAQTVLTFVFVALAFKLVGVWFWALTSKMVWPLMTRGNLFLGGSISICGMSLTCRRIQNFYCEIGNSWRQSTVHRREV